MDEEEGHELLAEKDLESPREDFVSPVLQKRPGRRILGSFGDLGATWNVRSSILRRLFFGLALWIVAVSVYLLARQTRSSGSSAWPKVKIPFSTSITSQSPFSGAFAIFPRKSALPKRHKRMTVVGAWNDDTAPSYLRHFFYTMQLNADTLDLLMINRLSTPESHCLDFEKVGINITWGGNIKVQCMDDNEWKRRHVDFLCSEEHGWNCNSAERDDVTKEYSTRPDANNYNWRPFRGYVFRDLFPNPENPLWAWMDHDVFVGNFARYPLNVLSQLSILTGTIEVNGNIFMPGQLTAFNMDDQALGSAWKKFPEMKSPAHFTKYLDGKMPESSEERYWSYGYLRSNEDLPGANLSYAVYSDFHGDDFFDGRWARKGTSTTYLISGRDVLLASSLYSRAEIEGLILMERGEPIDDLGGIGWTTGEDGSEYLLDQPSLSSSEAKAIAQSKAKIPQMHTGIVENLAYSTNCSVRPMWQQCVKPHPLEVSHPPVVRSTLVHLPGQEAGHILRRLELDDRSRGYERKFIKHHLKSKKLPWFEFPPFEITEDLVLRYNTESIEVFRMGETREETLFYREEGGKSIG